jgi:hypothetical protein
MPNNGHCDIWCRATPANEAHRVSLADVHWAFIPFVAAFGQLCLKSGAGLIPGSLPNSASSDRERWTKVGRDEARTAT